MVFLAAEPEGVNSLHVNACPEMSGDVNLLVKIEPVSLDNKSTSTCDYDTQLKAYVLTFYLPEYGFRNMDFQKPDQ
ncbi:MAG TPA: hypothetical protein VJ756_22920 [Terriglobales bacterium]|nr:hypothetical protein [Terriglobales bacterium]